MELPASWKQVGVAGGARALLDAVLREAVERKGSALPMAAGGAGDLKRLQLRLAGNIPLDPADTQTEPADGWYPGYGEAGAVDAALAVVCGGALGVKGCRVAESQALIRAGRGESHNPQKCGGGDQVLHCDVPAEVEASVGGMSVAFVTGAQGTHVWCAEHCGAPRRLVELPPYTATVLPAATGVHAGATFRRDNCILHTCVAHDGQRFDEVVAASAHGSTRVFLDAVDNCVADPKVATPQASICAFPWHGLLRLVGTAAPPRTPDTPAAGLRRATQRPAKGARYRRPKGHTIVNARSAGNERCLRFVLERRHPLRGPTGPPSDDPFVPPCLSGCRPGFEETRQWRHKNGRSAHHRLARPTQLRLDGSAPQGEGKCFCPATSFAAGTMKVTRSEFRSLQSNVDFETLADEVLACDYHLQGIPVPDTAADFFKAATSGTCLIGCHINGHPHWVAYNGWAGVLYEPAFDNVVVFEAKDFVGDAAANINRALSNVSVTDIDVCGLLWKKSNQKPRRRRGKKRKRAR